MSEQRRFDTETRFDIDRVKKDIDLLLGEIFRRKGSVRDRLITIETSLKSVNTRLGILMWVTSLLVLLVGGVFAGIVKMAFFDVPQ